MGKKFWICTVCKDVHYGAAGPAVCPTCHSKNAYVETTAEEARAKMGFE